MAVNGSLNRNLYTTITERIKSGTAGFIGQLERTLPGTRDGRVNKAESQQAYDTLLAQAGDQIPQEIKDRFKDGQAFADQFDRIDALGVSDGYVDEAEFSEFLSSEEAEAPSSEASADETPESEESPAEASEASAEKPPKPESKPEPEPDDD